MNALCVVGTDTQVGKTIVTSALAAYWQQYCRNRTLAIFKPVQAGIGDRERYHRCFDTQQTLEGITPLFFSTPIAPPLAADRENRTIDLSRTWQTFCQLQRSRDFVLVEGVGGLGSPITWELTVADLARDWHLPVILVVPVRLGAISQAVANVALARQCALDLRGIVLNCSDPMDGDRVADLAPAKLIETLTATPVVGFIPYLEETENVEMLARSAAELDLESFFSPAIAASRLP